MRLRALLIFVLPLLLIAADQKPAKTKAGSAGKSKQAVKVVPLKVPAGATLIEPGTWRYVDAKAKKTWIYRSTPFGITRYEEQPAVAAEEPPAEIKAFDEGDSVRFERQSPWGPSRWSKKKNELSETERQVWERDRPKDAADPKAGPGSAIK
jgi:hypothetical protein